MASTTADTTGITADTTLVTADADGTVSTTETYTDLVTAYHRDKPRFMATVGATVAPFADAQAVLSTIPEAFDLDEAVGAQLDVDGEWIGAGRTIATPLPNIYFSLDSDTLGLDQGLIQGPYDDDIGLTSLPDDVYRRVLQARAQLNGWNGQADSLAAILRQFLPNPATLISVTDESLAAQAPVFFSLDNDTKGLDQGVFDRPEFRLDADGFGVDEGFFIPNTEFGNVPDSLAGPLSIVLANKIPSNLDLAVLDAGILPMAPMGQDLEILVTSVDRAPVFGLDLDTALIGGLDIGAIGAAPGDLAAARV